MKITVPLIIGSRRHTYDKESLTAAMESYINDPKPKLGEYKDSEHKLCNILSSKLENSAFKITKIEKQDSDYLGHIEILDTPMGNLLKDFAPDRVEFNLVSVVSHITSRPSKLNRVVGARCFNKEG
jgi:hypothetical protein